ncbi:hypothetical protein [Streptococcus sp. zg-JUN1979]|uniref:hypothetical protein n=1 Tax=Streptococcus sp. zg-JUN1979 TaxID=3391450 RepID=UPI0039A40D8A
MSLTDKQQQIASKAIATHHNIEKNVIKAYQKTEKVALSSFNNISDKMIRTFFTKDGESLAETKQRLAKQKNKN